MLFERHVLIRQRLLDDLAQLQLILKLRHLLQILLQFLEVLLLHNILVFPYGASHRNLQLFFQHRRKKRVSVFIFLHFISDLITFRILGHSNLEVRAF